MKYLRLVHNFFSAESTDLDTISQDGNTKQVDRQKGMDAFNKPDSDVFIYILSTRAGGVSKAISPAIRTN